MELQSILRSTKIGELTLTDRPTLETMDTVERAAAEMRSASHGSALICTGGRLVGIFTERDLLRVLAERGRLDVPLADVMTADPETVACDDSVFDATRRMDAGGYRRLPVVDADGVPIGIVDVKTIVHFLVEHFPHVVYNQAARDHLIPGRREGA